MASNIDKVEDKATGDVDNAIKNSKTDSEFEKQLNPADLTYKIKDETKEDKK